MTSVVLLATLVLTAVLPTKATPLAGLHYLVGTWKCTYRAGAARLDYAATYAYDGGGGTLREVASWAGGGDEQLLSYDPQHGGWTAVVLDDHGNATVMRAPGSDPDRIAYRSIYPDASIVDTFERISATEYMLHATVRMGGKTITSADTCMRSAQ